MPRRAIGDRPLTPAERQAHQREKHKQQQAAMQRELESLRAENEALKRAYPRMRRFSPDDKLEPVISIADFNAI